MSKNCGAIAGAFLARVEEKAKKLLERFEKVAKTYPYPQEIEGERELIFASE